MGRGTGPEEEGPGEGMEERRRKAHLTRQNTRVTVEPGIVDFETTDDDEYEEEETTSSSPEKWWSTVVAGGIAGAVSRTSVAPLERLKILFQVQGLSARGAPLRYVGVWPSLVSLYKKDGLLGLWKGNGMNCARVIPSSAIQFTSYRFYRLHLFGDDGTGAVQLKPWQHVIAGGMAGATATTITYPIDLMRARHTVDFRGDVPTGLFSGLRHVLRTEGLRGCYRGLLPSLCGIIPYLGIDFAVFDYLKRTCKARDFGVDRNSTRHDLLPQVKLVCGALAGVCGMTVAFPFDTARRNLQVASLKARDGPPLTMWSFFAGVVRQDGFFALYRGIKTNYLKASPSVAISFTTFETFKHFFDDLPW